MKLITNLRKWDFECRAETHFQSYTESQNPVSHSASEWHTGWNVFVAITRRNKVEKIINIRVLQKYTGIKLLEPMLVKLVLFLVGIFK